MAPASWCPPSRCSSRTRFRTPGPELAGAAGPWEHCGLVRPGPAIRGFSWGERPRHLSHCHHIEPHAWPPLLLSAGLGSSQWQQGLTSVTTAKSQQGSGVQPGPGTAASHAGPSGAFWSLHPGCRLPRICAAGLSSRHLNHSHKLLSAFLGGLLDTASRRRSMARQRPRRSSSPGCSRESLHSPACDPLSASAPQQRLGRAWGGAGTRLGDSVLLGMPQFRGRRGSTAAWPLRTAQPGHQHGHSDITASSPSLPPARQAHLPTAQQDQSWRGGRFPARTSGPSPGKAQTPPCGRQGGAFMRGPGRWSCLPWTPLLKARRVVPRRWGGTGEPPGP